MLSKTLIICLVCLVQTLAVGANEAEPREITPQTFDIRFPGGNLRDLTEAIKTQNEGIIPNIMMDEHAGSVLIPPFYLVNVSLMELMEALQYVDPRLEIDAPSEAVFAISAMEANIASFVAIYDIRYLLDPNSPQHFNMDDIATAIRTGWDMIPLSSEPAMKVHQETNLMIVRGNKEEQVIAETVIRQLSDQQKQKNSSAASSALRRQLSVLQQRYDALVKTIDSLREENSNLKAKLVAATKATE